MSTSFGFQEGKLEPGQPIPTGVSPAEYPGFSLDEASVAAYVAPASAEEAASYDAVLAKALDVLQKDFHPSKMYLAEDQALALAKIDFHLKKAMVNHLLGETEAQLKGDDPNKGVYGEVSKLYDNAQESAYRLAHVIRPRIELIYDLKRHIDKIKRIRGDPAKGIPMDPDYKRCIFKLNTTLEYLQQDVAPHVQQFLELTSPQGLQMPFGAPIVASGFEAGMPGPHKEKGVTMHMMGGGRKRSSRKRSSKKKRKSRKRSSRKRSSRKRRRSPARRKSSRRANVISF